MTDESDREWLYQLRVYLPEELAETVYSGRGDPTLQPLTQILDRHDATLVSQFGAFENYVAQAEAEGAENFPLYKWTKATIDDPAKRAKHITSFALRVSDNEVYPKPVADALEADLHGLVGGNLIMRMSKHDTNPANNPQMPAEYRQ